MRWSFHVNISLGYAGHLVVTLQFYEKGSMAYEHVLNVLNILIVVIYSM